MPHVEMLVRQRNLNRHAALSNNRCRQTSGIVSREISRRWIGPFPAESGHRRGILPIAADPRTACRKIFAGFHFILRLTGTQPPRSVIPKIHTGGHYISSMPPTYVGLARSRNSAVSGVLA